MERAAQWDKPLENVDDVNHFATRLEGESV